MFKKYKIYIVIATIIIVGICFYAYSSNGRHQKLIHTGTRYIDDSGRGLIKGNINSSTGDKIYHLQDDQYYKRTNPEKWFITEAEAQDAGFRKSMK